MISINLLLPVNEHLLPILGHVLLLPVSLCLHAVVPVPVPILLLAAQGAVPRHQAPSTGSLLQLPESDSTQPTIITVILFSVVTEHIRILWDQEYVSIVEMMGMVVIGEITFKDAFKLL